MSSDVAKRPLSDNESPEPGPDPASQFLPPPVTEQPCIEPRSSWSRLKGYLMKDVDPEQSTLPLACYCFMTGYIDVITFSAIFVWSGFQTGNTIQLALAVARICWGPPSRETSFRIPDKQALMSLCSFLGGAFLGRAGDRIGAKTRLWLCAGTVIQAIFTAAAAISVWKSGQKSISVGRGDLTWTNAAGFLAMGFASASLGLQGIMGKRLNTQLATTVVLTSVWCELMVEPDLFHIYRPVRSRDLKLLAILALFLGGFLGRGILEQIGAAGAFGVAAGLRMIIAINWVFIPAKN
ncbi:hypothetical protein BD410DRAFT_789682 [Rickenella mellea]|uniref:DUF1275 domain protein n=1 Tax=Rickenella mellea TaxID=50990 RepID=A0A4Y7Q3T1_9AGAM|nr:hypothetical protein BD410DRAFT_789682 [Rickenella mellea]